MQTPHFDIPFRFGAKGAVTVEQDSFEDIANCVEVIVRTPVGFRDDNPSFGFPQTEFSQQPIITSDVVEIVASQEPRAVVVMSDKPDALDELIDRILIDVRGINQQ